MKLKQNEQLKYFRDRKKLKLHKLGFWNYIRKGTFIDYFLYRAVI